MRKASILLVAVVLMLSVVMAHAQDDESDAMMAAEQSTIYIQEAETGSFMVDEDGQIMLILGGWGTEISFLQTVPVLMTDFAQAAAIYTGWVTVDDLVASNSILRLEDGTVTLALSNPVYDPAEGTVTYMVDIEELDVEGYTLEGKSGPELPEDFSATLFIVTDPEFDAMLQEGLENAGLRCCDDPG